MHAMGGSGNAPAHCNVIVQARLVVAAAVAVVVGVGALLLVRSCRRSVDQPKA